MTVLYSTHLPSSLSRVMKSPGSNCEFELYFLLGCFLATGAQTFEFRKDPCKHSVISSILQALGHLSIIVLMSSDMDYLLLGA